MSLQRIQKKCISCISRTNIRNRFPWKIQSFFMLKVKAKKWNKIKKKDIRIFFVTYSSCDAHFYIVFLFVWNFEYTRDLTYLCMHFPYLIWCFIFYYIFYGRYIQKIFFEKSLAIFEFRKLLRHLIVFILLLILIFLKFFLYIKVIFLLLYIFSWNV